MNGKKLAAANQDSFLEKIVDDPWHQASDLFRAVGILLRKQQKKNLFEDYDEYEIIMDTRGKQCFDCHIGTHLEHVKRNLIVFFLSIFPFKLWVKRNFSGTPVQSGTCNFDLNVGKSVVSAG